MAETHVWVRHVEHGGYWRCPADALDDQRELGWELSDAPEEVNPAVAERIAWERAQAEAAQVAEEKKPKSTKAAPRAASTVESE